MFCHSYVGSTCVFDSHSYSLTLSKKVLKDNFGADVTQKGDGHSLALWIKVNKTHQASLNLKQIKASGKACRFLP